MSAAAANPRYVIHPFAHCPDCGGDRLVPAAGATPSWFTRPDPAVRASWRSEFPRPSGPAEPGESRWRCVRCGGVIALSGARPDSPAA
jgi:hypothetical protein